MEPITDKLKKELPEMLLEHKLIVTALKDLVQRVKTEYHPEVVAFAEKLNFIYIHSKNGKVVTGFSLIIMQRISF